jgi:hypothetical protein
MPVPVNSGVRRHDSDSGALQLSVSKFQIVEIIGVVSVALSLLFVAYQIQQTNQIAIVSTEIEIRNNYSQLNEAMFSDSDLAKLIERAADPDYQPLVGERTQLRSLAFRFMNIWLASEIAYRNGMLPERGFLVVLDDIGYLLDGVAYMRIPFREILDNYPGWANTEVVKAIEMRLRTADDA